MTTPVEASLQRQDLSTGAFVPWYLDDTDPDAPAGVASDPTIDYGVRAGIGTPADAEATSVTSGSVIAYLKAIWSRLAGTLTVSGTVSVSDFPATQPVSGSVTADQGGTWSVGVDNFPATQPVSAASLPLPTGAAQDGTDGTGIASPAGAVGIRGWLSGIYKAITGTLTVAGSVDVANLPATQAVSGTVSVSDFPAIQPVSGTVTADQGGAWSVATPDLDNRFYSLLNQRIPDGHEMRSCLQETSYFDPEGSGTTYTGADGSSIYMGHAPAGTALTAAAWDVIRLYLDSTGSPVLWRTLTGVAWLTDSVTAGVINGGALSGGSLWG